MQSVESSTDCIDPVWVGSTGAGGTIGVTGSITSVTFGGVTVVTGGKTGSVTVLE
jgi:hypothetical protein